VRVVRQAVMAAIYHLPHGKEPLRCGIPTNYTI
jgi:hypothetical protein